jgi:hypothetical protein
MALLDHFHPPLSINRHWEAFHAHWAVALAERLNQDMLPDQHFAEAQVHVGGRVEVDVAAFEYESRKAREHEPERSSSSVATAIAPSAVWTPPKPALQIPAIFPDMIETLIYSTEAGPTLVGAVEFVSPGNKDRPEARRAFAAKVASYLQEGIGVVVVDIVTNRRVNLHNEMVALLDHGEPCRMPDDPFLYAAAYRPFRHPSLEATDVWLAGLAVGQPLPTLPLFLRGGPCLPIELEATYAGLCGRIRLV